MVDFSVLENALSKDPTIGWRMQFQALVCGLNVKDGNSKTVRIGPAAIKVEDGLSDDADFTLIANQSAWDEYASDAPPVGAQTLSALVETNRMDVESRDIVVYARHAMLLEKLFSQLRPPKTVSAEPYSEIEIEPVMGRYIRMNIGGRPHRLYYEEAGEGTPLICLHTAGSDGRQYRALMNNPEITDRFRVIAFDLPWHGKSAPPPGFHTEPYILTTDGYMGVVMEFVDALGLENPVVMGCSIGGRAVLHLALRHGDRFKAAIGLQSATHAESNAMTKLDLEDKHVLYRPDIHGGEFAAASVMTLMSPTSPTEHEWETLWYYMQGGPGVFMGDLNYYFVDGDMRNGLVDGIDTSECPLYLLSGEYDLSATPEMGRELAEAVNATHFEVMTGVGHFPMSEDPVQFASYLLPVLSKIENQPR